MELSPSLTPATCVLTAVTLVTLGDVRDHFWLDVKTGDGRFTRVPKPPFPPPLAAAAPSFLRGLGPRPPLARVGDSDPLVWAALAAPLPLALGESDALIRLGSMLPPPLGDDVLMGDRRRGVVGRTLFALVC